MLGDSGQRGNWRMGNSNDRDGDGRAASLPKPVKIAPERRELIEAHIAGLARNVHAIAAELPLQADTSDFLRVLDEAGRE
jgi:hypothetical protein